MVECDKKHESIQNLLSIFAHRQIYLLVVMCITQSNREKESQLLMHRKSLECYHLSKQQFPLIQ